MNATTETSRKIARVNIRVNTTVCRMCGGSGKDAYLHGRECRKCSGSKAVMTPAGVKAHYAWMAYQRDIAAKCGEDGPTQQDMQDAVAFIATLRGATAKVAYEDEI